jgi:hypothetical protein
MMRLLVVLLVVGCGSSSGQVPVEPAEGDAGAADAGPVALTADFITGSRLKGRYAVTAGGLRQFRGPHDAMLNRPCQFTAAEDGKIRCLPVVPVAMDFEGGEVLYRDADCSEMLLPEATGCAGGYGFKVTAMGWAIYHLGPAAPVTAAYRATATGCQALASAPGASFYTLGEAVPPTSFVAVVGSRSDGPPGQRLHPVFSRAEDGSELRAASLHDSQLNLDCAVRSSIDALNRCLPAGAAIATPGATFTYLDAQCTHRLAATRTAVTHLLVAEGVNKCEVTSKVYTVGAVVSNDSLFRVANGSCAPFTNTDGTIYRDVGAEVPGSMFAALTSTTLSSGVLRQRHLAAEGVVLLGDQWNTNHGVLCTFQDTAGGPRCLPPADRAGFADGQCGSAAARSGLGACYSGVAVMQVASVPAGPWCARVVSTSAVGVTVEGGAFGRDPAGACVAISGSTDYRSVTGPADQGVEPATEVLE